MGRGNVPPEMVPGIARFIDDGKPVVIASRAQRGRVGETYAYEGGGRRLHAMGAILAGGRRPQQARIELLLALGAGMDMRARCAATSRDGAATRERPRDEAHAQATGRSARHRTHARGGGVRNWFVGGAVRDALLGHAHLDWDLATAATPAQVRRLFKRTVPVGIKFGTMGVLDPKGEMHEVTTFRRDVRTDGRHAEVEFGVSLDEDLARRDFTVNAIAYSTSRKELRDPFDGRGDLARSSSAPWGTPTPACGKIACARCARSGSPRASASRSSRPHGGRSSRARRISIASPWSV